MLLLMRSSVLRSVMALALTSLVGTTACVEEAELGVLPGDAVAASSGSGDGGAGGDDAATGGPTGNGGDAAGGGDPILPCSTWEGPFGTEASETLDPNQFWRGFKPGDATSSDVTLEDFAACGGGGEVKAIVVYIEAMWCAVCRDVTSRLAEKYETEWKDRGVAVISLLVEDVDGNPATEESAWLWRSTYGLEAMAVAYDPTYGLANESPDSLPQAVLVDPVTMRIYGRAIGNVDLDPYIADIIAGSTGE